MQPSINPATSEGAGRYSLNTAAEVDAAVAAQRAWRHTPVESRLELLSAIARELRADLERLARAVTSEMDKPLVEARAGVGKSAKTTLSYGTAYRSWAGLSRPGPATAPVNSDDDLGVAQPDHVAVVTFSNDTTGHGMTVGVQGVRPF